MTQFPAEQSKSGAFHRQEDAFRDWVKRDGSTRYNLRLIATIFTSR